MKIALFEWSCGGGLLDTATGDASPSLSPEGWLMLKSLADGLVDAGLEVIVPIDLRVVPQAAAHTRAHVVDMSTHAPTTCQALMRRWAEIANECDYLWVIAPEINGLLGYVLSCLQDTGKPLLNCRGEFLRNCSNKRLTATALTAVGIAHPPTLALTDINPTWLDASAHPADSVLPSQADLGWIIKPDTGAGGANQHLVTRQQLLQMAENPAASPHAPPATTWLVQPWWPGQPASCTAIIDAQGKRHWMPLVSQDFGPSKSKADQATSLETNKLATAPPQYVGCTFPCSELPQAAPLALLETTLDALGQGAYGPVGIDLLFHPATQTWTIIEVNARCTSSLLAMAAAYRGNLVGEMFQLLTSPCATTAPALAGHLSPFQFRVANELPG